MFRLLTWALKPASSLTDSSVLCRLSLCIFRDYLNTQIYISIDVLFSPQCHKASKFSVVASLDATPVSSSYRVVKAYPSNLTVTPCHKIPYLQCIFLCQNRHTVVVSR